MSSDQTRQQQSKAPPAPQAEAPTGPSPLLEQAAKFREVAQKSLAECERGEDAQRELERRRNRSGQ